MSSNEMTGNDDTTTPRQTIPTATDSLREHRARLLAARLAAGPALLELDDAIELFWAYQHRIGACHPIGDDDQNKQLLRLAKDAGLFAGICRAIVAGEEFYQTAENRAARAAAVGRARIAVGELMKNEGRRDVRSHRVGRATLATGGVTMAYRAVVAFTCVQCAGAIPSGALFSRQTRHTPSRGVGMPTTNPVCVTCRPLRLEDTGETEAAAPDARED